jgi:hypothetical protein
VRGSSPESKLGHFQSSFVRTSPDLTKVLQSCFGAVLVHNYHLPTLSPIRVAQSVAGTRERVPHRLGHALAEELEAFSLGTCKWPIRF